MYKSTLLFLICVLFFSVGCNRKQAVVQQVQETPEVVEEVVEEEVKEPEVDPREQQVANASKAISQFGELMQLTESQKAEIYQMAYRFDFSADSDAEAEQKYKAFRKDVKNILTEEQKQKIKDARKKQKKDGK